MSSAAALVLGHMNPDSDAIVSAIALAHLNQARGLACTAVAQGALNPETEFVLGSFGVSAPEVVSDVSGKDLWLVDFSDLAQGPQGMDSATVLGIVDHHKLGDVTTSSPLEAWIWPVGCSCTVLKNMYDFYGVSIPKEIAGIMMGAILSDTVMFKSPTTTDPDKKAAAELAKIAGVDDMMAFAMDMFKAKSSLAGATMNELLHRDYKEFVMGGKKIGIGALEVVDLSLFDSIKDDLQKAVEAEKADGRHTVFLLLTDVLNGNSELLFSSDDPSMIEQAFGVKPEGNKAWLPGVMSRKKQVVPNLEKLLK